MTCPPIPSFRLFRPRCDARPVGVIAAAAGAWLCGCAQTDADSATPLADGEPGTYVLSFEHDGELREAIVHVPTSAAEAGPAPLLLNFHGFGGTAEDHMAWADMRPVADNSGFVVAYPQGTDLDGESHWNTSLPSDDNKSEADDFGFIDGLLDAISASYAIDSDRIYAAGYSNGAMFSFALACFRTDRFAAVASVSGTMLDDIGVACTPSHPTAVITLHGTDDSVLPYDGESAFGPNAEDVLEYWTGFNGIDSAPETATTSAGERQVDSFEYLGGDGGTEVHHHRVVGGGHVWLDVEVGGSNTNQLLWDFLSRFGRSGQL